MTTRQKFETMLTELAVPETDAAKIMDIAIPVIDSTFDNYNITWDSPCEDYTDGLYSILFYSNVKPIALAWVEEHKPQAWFKPALMTKEQRAEIGLNF